MFEVFSNKKASKDFLKNQPGINHNVLSFLYQRIAMQDRWTRDIKQPLIGLMDRFLFGKVKSFFLYFPLDLFPDSRRVSGTLYFCLIINFHIKYEKLSFVHPR